MHFYRTTLVQAIAILALSAGIAVASVWLHPRAPTWFLVQEADQWSIRPDQIAALGDQVVWIDARTEADYSAGHVRGALLLNEDQWGEQMFALQDVLQEAIGKPVVVYCDGAGCERSAKVAERLRQLVGLEPVYVLRGDWHLFGEH